MAESGLVLVTGSAGRIGQAVVQELRGRGHRVRGFDLAPTPGGESVVGDLTDASAVQKAMAGVTTLVHLAATPDDDDFLTKLLPPNIIGVYHVLEAARHAGVKRMILASSGQVVWYQRQHGPWPIGIEVPTSPRYWYAATKVFLEAIGQGFAETHGMQVVAVRLGWCPRTPEQVEEIRASDWAQNVYLSPSDAGRFFACAVEATSDFRYAVVYATSRPARREYVDLAPARTLLGYEPQEAWPEGIEVIVGSR
jgi:nucleoside-diphosphate-sugar epimerase